jgi:hypothetical protein
MRVRRPRVRVPSPAMTVALVALFIAMGGSAVAAKHYLINSTSQINPKVLKKLRGNRGPTGPKGSPGTSGAPGTNGAPGAKGEPGTSAVSYFARINIGGTVEAGTPGVTAKAIPPEGFDEVVFPQDVSRCAVLATGVSGGGPVLARQSTNSEKNKVVIVTYNEETAVPEKANEPYNLIVTC